jgi:hypothetical protein
LAQTTVFTESELENPGLSWFEALGHPEANPNRRSGTGYSSRPTGRPLPLSSNRPRGYHPAIPSVPSACPACPACPEQRRRERSASAAEGSKACPEGTRRVEWVFSMEIPQSASSAPICGLNPSALARHSSRRMPDERRRVYLCSSVAKSVCPLLCSPWFTLSSCLCAFVVQISCRPTPP